MQNNPGSDTAALLVTFHPPNASKVVPELFLSPRVERFVYCSACYVLYSLEIGQSLLSKLMDCSEVFMSGIF